MVGERKTVKNRNRNHIFFISTIVGWSLLWFEAVTAPGTDSTCFALNDRETFIHSHTRTHTHKHILVQLAELAYESCGKSVSLNFENVLQFPKISTHSHRGKETLPRSPETNNPNRLWPSAEESSGIDTVPGAAVEKEGARDGE